MLISPLRAVLESFFFCPEASCFRAVMVIEAGVHPSLCVFACERETETSLATVFAFLKHQQPQPTVKQLHVAHAQEPSGSSLKTADTFDPAPSCQLTWTIRWTAEDNRARPRPHHHVHQCDPAEGHQPSREVWPKGGAPLQRSVTRLNAQK